MSDPVYKQFEAAYSRLDAAIRAVDVATRSEYVARLCGVSEATQARYMARVADALGDLALARDALAALEAQS